MSIRKRRAKTRKTKSKKARKSAYLSVGWERIAVLAAELNVLAAELGLYEVKRDPDGFDLADAARELARLADNYNREVNPEGRNAEAEKSDWVSIGGMGADLGNMADEQALPHVSARVRAVAHELCYRACDYLF